MESKSKKSVKAKWIKELILIAGRRELLTKRNIADIIGVTISTITDAMNYGNIKHYVKLGPDKSKHPVFIPLWAAVEFVEGFKEEILPVQLMLPFQELNQENKKK